ncbi:16S rRNA (adenine(1518)-N(6)/adenine(1519)-N(6))-dimethyltransferase RsmA [Balneola sp. MJW-20]|uniref:16S rRNA (adenine(1518)-N(6)/adenine(1519)-N(6))- dimethyltransferase RsmA n=1 Tax=Gracilimonas aurantiaca TaxID=3234185 RepID=UPI0034676535
MSFRTKKSLGQHFLHDGNIIRKIADAIPAKTGDRVIEIGPGTGALTRELLNRFEDIQVIEIDQRAVEVLNEEFPDLIIHQQDVLKTNWDDLISKTGDTYVVGNLPYYITSPILFSVLEKRDFFKEALFMMQKEVAERLVAEHSSKEYGILSVQTQLMSEPEILFDVSRHSFSPPPRVTSAVIRLRFNKPELPFKDETMKKVVRTAFNQRRKKLSNALKPLLGKELPEGFNYDDRAEHWSPETYAKLSERLEQTDSIS